MRDQTALRLFDQFAKTIRSETMGPVLATNTNTGASSVVKTARYSSGAERFILRGGALRQEGVRNIEFRPK